MAKSMPRAVARRIMERAAKHKALVLVTRDGTPTRVFALERYLKKQADTKQRKPWNHRKKTGTPDPLGAVDTKVLRPITREEMYEE